MLGSKLLSTTVRVRLANHLDYSRESIHNLIKGQFIGFSFPLIFEQEKGSQLRDVLDTGFVSLFLISNKLKLFLETNNIKGYDTFQIDIRAKDNSHIADYWGLSITGKCGAVDFGKSDITEKQLVYGAPKLRNYMGLHIGLEKWDGSDIFTPDKHLGIIVTNELREKLEKGKFTNIRFNNLAEIETPILPDFK